MQVDVLTNKTNSHRCGCRLDARDKRLPRAQINLAFDAQGLAHHRVETFVVQDERKFVDVAHVGGGRAGLLHAHIQGAVLGEGEAALGLIEACVERGVPLFGICRGLQEMNVAFGGSLHPEIRDIPGRMNHRMPRLANGEIHPDPEVVFADRHEVTLAPQGAFAKLLGREKIKVNSLHGQGILEPGKRVVIEGVAEDGTIEAISIADAPGFALGVQWHAEYDPQSNPINRTLFEAFGAALRAGRR